MMATLSIASLYFYNGFLCADTNQSSSNEADAKYANEIQKWLLETFSVNSDTIKVSVHKGYVYLTGTAKSYYQREAIILATQTLPGVIKVISELKFEEKAAQKTEPTVEEIIKPEKTPTHTFTRTATPTPTPTPTTTEVPVQPAQIQEPSAEARKTILFPRKMIFPALLANPKEPKAHASWQSYNTKYGADNISSFSFGEQFGIVEYSDSDRTNSWQICLTGAAFSLFRFTKERGNLINSDYVIGIPVSYRNKEWSFRTRLYHQSSHFGGEYQFASSPDEHITAIRYSYEAVEFLGAYDLHGARFFGGGSFLFSSTPKLSRGIAQAGMDYCSQPLRFKPMRFVSGIYAEYWSETSAKIQVSIKTGLEFRAADLYALSIKFLVEYYNGNIPHGQLYFDTEVDYFGIGFILDF
jgi:hypothetical protein